MEIKKVKEFRDLGVYQLSVQLAKEVYRTVEKLPNKENYVIKDQLLRAVNSVGANIAEGFGRYSGKEFVKFLYIARGSLMEVLHFLNVSLELNYITDKEFESFDKKIRNLGVKINNLITAIKNKAKE